MGDMQLALAEPQTLSTELFLDKEISNKLSQKQDRDFEGKNGIRLWLYFVPPVTSLF